MEENKRINGELVLGGTRVDFSRGKLSGFCGVFYKGTNLFNLYYFTTGPQQMKDIRYVQLTDGKVGVMIYTVGDTAEGRVIIENPFPAKIKE